MSTKPLSQAAQKAALAPLGDLKRCLAKHGYDVGKPIVKIMSRGRAAGWGRTGAPQTFRSHDAFKASAAIRHGRPRADRWSQCDAKVSV